MGVVKKVQIASMMLVFFITSQPAFAGDGVPVSSMTIIRLSPVSSGPYVIGGDTITYGTGDNVQMTSVVVGGVTLTRSAVSKPSITIRRINNAAVTGERLTFFYAGTASGSTVNLEGEEATSMEAAMNDDYLTSGGLDVFLNVDSGTVERANNIERVDFVLTGGMTLPTTPALLSEVGTIANEKHGNNSYKIAMITSLDAFGQPASYGDLKIVQALVDYGNVGRPQNSSGTNLRNLFLRNGAVPVGADNGPVAYIRGDTNFIGLSFVSFAALGAVPGQVVYGYSLFPNDMFDSNDLVGLSDAPLNTSGGINGGDIFGGTFAVFTSTAAEPETVDGAVTVNLSIAKSSAVFDPLSAGLFNIPGNDVVYTISVQNSGNGPPDIDATFVVDSLPATVEFYNGDIDGAGPETDPVVFADFGTGMTFDYAADVSFSDSVTPPTTFVGCTYTPIAGYDPDVKHICFLPSGTMAGNASGPYFEHAYPVTFPARQKQLEAIGLAETIYPGTAANIHYLETERRKK